MPLFISLFSICQNVKQPLLWLLCSGVRWERVAYRPLRRSWGLTEWRKKGGVSFHCVRRRGKASKAFCLPVSNVVDILSLSYFRLEGVWKAMSSELMLISCFFACFWRLVWEFISMRCEKHVHGF